MKKELIETCQLFLVPATILFAAIGIARTEPLKTLISALGAGLSLLWLYRILEWPDRLRLEIPDQVTALGLASVFALAAAVSTVVHAWRWTTGKHEREFS
jgi:hypothetical protein